MLLRLTLFLRRRVDKMEISNRTARIIEFLPIIFACSLLVIPLVLAFSTSGMTPSGVKSYFWTSTEPPVKF
jgi:hypothetical protein